MLGDGHNKKIKKDGIVRKTDAYRKVGVIFVALSLILSVVFIPNIKTRAAGSISRSSSGTLYRTTFPGTSIPAGFGQFLDEPPVASSITYNDSAIINEVQFQTPAGIYYNTRLPHNKIFVIRTKARITAGYDGRMCLGVYDYASAPDYNMGTWVVWPDAHKAVVSWQASQNRPFVYWYTTQTWWANNTMPVDTDRLLELASDGTNVNIKVFDPSDMSQIGSTATKAWGDPELPNPTNDLWAIIGGTLTGNANYCGIHTYSSFEGYLSNNITVTGLSTGNAVRLYNASDDSVLASAVESGGTATLDCSSVNWVGLTCYLKVFTDGTYTSQLAQSSNYTDASGGDSYAYSYVIDPPTALTMNAPTNVTANSIQWNWIPGAGGDPATSYKLMGGTSPGADNLIQDGITNQYLNESGLSPNTHYYRHVHGVNAGGDSVASNEVDKWTLSSPPNGLNVVPDWDAVNGYKCNLSWTNPAPGSFDHIHIYQGGPSGTGSLIYNSNGSSYTHGGLTANTPYTYYLYSVNGEGTEVFGGSYSYSWTPQTSGTSEQLNSVSALDPTHVWACGENGKILFFNGSWVTQTTGTSERFNGISALDSTDVWAVSESGNIYFYNGSWALQSAPGGILRSVTVLDSNHVWACGDSGAIYFYNGISWAPQTSGTPQNLFAISALDSTHVWAGGGSGTIRFYNGASWSGQTSGTTESIYGLSALDSAHVWAVSSNYFSMPANSTIHFFDGYSWSPQAENLLTYLFSITALDSSHVWACGTSGDVRFYNGVSWVSQISGTSEALLGASSVSASTHAWLVGTTGTILYSPGPSEVAEGGTTPPAKPTGLHHTGNTTSTISWDWDDTASATGYKVYRASDDTELADVANSNWDQGSLSPNVQSTIYVRAYNTNGQGAPSDNSSAYTSIQNPTGATWGTITVNSIQLSGAGTISNLSSGSSGIYFRESVTGTNSGWLTTNSWTRGGLSSNTQYHFYITTQNGDGDTNTEQGPYDRYTLADVPTAPSSSSGYNPSAGYYIDVSWTSGGSQSGYHVYRGGQSGSGTLVYNGAGTSFTNSGLSEGTAYTYYIYSVNGDGTENPSFIQTSATTSPGPPTGLNAFGTTQTSTTITWNSVTGATGYVLSYGTDPNAENLGTQSVSGTSAALSGLIPGTTYYVKVRALGTSSGAWSVIYSFQTNKASNNNPINPLSTGTSILILLIISAVLFTGINFIYFRQGKAKMK